MASRPELPYGYLGPQSKFSEWSLSCISHSNPDIRTDSNQLEIKLRTPKPMKVSCAQWSPFVSGVHHIPLCVYCRQDEQEIES